MDLGIENKVAVVLGAAGGLGGAISKALLEAGAKVAMVDIDQQALDQTRAALDPEAKRSMALQWNLADTNRTDQQISSIEDALGQVEILVNNTGGPPPGSIVGQAEELWQDCYSKMVQPVIAITDRVVPKMRENGWGRVITSTSSGVVSPIPNLGLSNALRSTLVGWSKTLAGEVAKSGITSNIILPGRIATDRINFLDEKKAEREGRSVDDVRTESLASIPAGRYGDPQEYGDVVAFLASKRASYINGSIIRVDGGYISSI